MPRGPSVVLALPRIGRAAAFYSDAAPGRLGQGARVERNLGRRHVAATEDRNVRRGDVARFSTLPLPGARQASSPVAQWMEQPLSKSSVNSVDGSSLFIHVRTHDVAITGSWCQGPFCWNCDVRSVFLRSQRREPYSPTADTAQSGPQRPIYACLGLTVPISLIRLLLLLGRRRVPHVDVQTLDLFDQQENRLRSWSHKSHGLTRHREGGYSRIVSANWKGARQMTASFARLPGVA
jgi:hypothetical protein